MAENNLLAALYKCTVNEISSANCIKLFTASEIGSFAIDVYCGFGLYSEDNYLAFEFSSGTVTYSDSGETPYYQIIRGNINGNVVAKLKYVKSTTNHTITYYLCFYNSDSSLQACKASIKKELKFGYFPDLLSISATDSGLTSLTTIVEDVIKTSSGSYVVLNEKNKINTLEPLVSADSYLGTEENSFNNAHIDEIYGETLGSNINFFNYGYVTNIYGNILGDSSADFQSAHIRDINLNSFNISNSNSDNPLNDSSVTKLSGYIDDEYNQIFLESNTKINISAKNIYTDCDIFSDGNIDANSFTINNILRASANADGKTVTLKKVSNSSEVMSYNASSDSLYIKSASLNLWSDNISLDSFDVFGNGNAYISIIPNQDIAGLDFYADESTGGKIAIHYDVEGNKSYVLDTSTSGSFQLSKEAKEEDSYVLVSVDSDNFVISDNSGKTNKLKATNIETTNISTSSTSGITMSSGLTLGGLLNLGSNAIYCTSDIRLKDIKEEFTSTPKWITDVVKNTKVIDYSFKSDESHKTHIGVKAQELEKNLPDKYKESFINTTDNFSVTGLTDQKSINKEDMLFLLWSEVQRLQAKVEELESRLEK